MDKKVKILRIIARLNIGGPAIHCILLTHGLNKNRFHSLLATGSVDSHEADMIYLAKSKNVVPIIIPALSRNISFINDLRTFLRLFLLILREKPDIIHTHTAKAGTLGRLAGLLYNLIVGKKRCILIHTFHGHVLHSYFGRFKTRVFICIERILAQFTDKIIAVSQTVKKELLELGIGSPDKLIVIHLGLELDQLLSIPIERNSGPKIGIVGRLTKIKNHAMFLETVKLILSNHSSVIGDRQFIIVGDGELKNTLESYAQELGLNNYVTFTGWQKDLVNLYSNLDIVALTSLNEGNPVSLIEAMAAGCAVVATDVGGVRDLINPVCQLAGLPPENILVSSKDAEAFTKSLINLMKNKDLRIKIGEAGRGFVRDRFRKERLIEDMERLYGDLLAEKEIK
ncbi:MAG: glycosyltransferase [Candidatus Omnitrophota bacterium]